jgi:DNA primase
MTDPDDQVMGIRLRFPDGKKLAIRGGREGLFIPTNVKFDQNLLICEGPTDTAALLDLGFNVVGRPSCCGGTHLIVELVRRHWPLKVVIVSDSDIPGQRGANDLAETLVPYALTVCIIKPPDGIKDARDWKRYGATAANIQAAIEAAPIKRVSIEGVRV